MSGLTNIYVNKILKKYCNDFKGVFSSNNINFALCGKKKFSIVCNLAKKEEQGTHFITIIANEIYIFYIDSYGIPCTNFDISRFMHECKREIIYNSKQIQHEKSFFCGYYSILFVLINDKAIPKSKKPILKFSNNLLKNDKKCINYILKMII